MCRLCIMFELFDSVMVENKNLSQEALDSSKILALQLSQTRDALKDLESLLFKHKEVLSEAFSSEDIASFQLIMGYIFEGNTLSEEQRKQILFGIHEMEKQYNPIREVDIASIPTEVSKNVH